MGKNVAKKLIESHLVSGKMQAGQEIAIKIDQTLTQDATGTMVMLELEAMGIDRAKTELSCQYVDHNQIQEDHKNPDDHLFLQSAAKRFGLYFSRPGNGISHEIETEMFGLPGKTLIGSDSHTPASGCLGMFAVGAGGFDVALAIAGEPFYLTMPKIVGVQVVGKLPEWVSAKDVILEMLRRYGVSGGVGKVFEYYGPGIENLTLMDRHVICNMGAELGATTSIFPSDHVTKQFFKQMGRAKDWSELKADPGAIYDEQIEIDLSELEPLIACPTSPGNVVPVREVAGRPIYQSYIGSSANPGYCDYEIVAKMMKGQKSHENVSLDVNPSSRTTWNCLTENGFASDLIESGARIHQAGCNGCIGMGQAPATGRISLRTVPRNFPGRSGTKEDQVYLCSPETAAASALKGEITDPRTLQMKYPGRKEPKRMTPICDIIEPIQKGHKKVELIKGPNIGDFPCPEELVDHIKAPVVIKLGDNVSTDEISPAGAAYLPYRSNIPEISKFTFTRVDPNFYERAMKLREKGSIIIAGDNYGQGSSREHAAAQPCFLGVQVIIAKSFARIHRSNLINFGILALTFQNPGDYERIDEGDELELSDLKKKLSDDQFAIELKNLTKGESYRIDHHFLKREREAILAGGTINLVKKKTLKSIKG